MKPEARGQAAEGAATPRSSDGEIVERIATVLHDPFRDVWRRHERDAWDPVRRVLLAALAGHERALAGLAAGGDGGGETDGEEGTHVGEGIASSEAVARYRRAVATDVLAQIRAILRGPGVAADLEASLARAADTAEDSADALPALVRAPMSPSALRGGRGLDPWSAVKRVCARALRPIVWRSDERDVAVPLAARRHLARVVLPLQARAFREAQRLRADWLADLERAWSAWLPALRPPTATAAATEGGGAATVAARKAGERLQRELRALADRVSVASGRSGGEELARPEEALRAAVAVAGTFVGGGSGEDAGADGAGGGWHPRNAEVAGRWDRRARESAARLELCAALLDARHAFGGIRRDLGLKWVEAVNGVDAVLMEIEGCLERGKSRAKRIAGDDPSLARELAREGERTVDEIAEAEGRLQDPTRLLAALTRAANQAIERLEAAGSRMPGSLEVHRVPPAGVRIRRPGRPGQSVRLRDAARRAFDSRRREHIRLAPEVVREAMARVHLMVAELREVSAYGYEAAIAELSERGGADAVDPVRMVTDGLAGPGRKAAGARYAISVALATAVERVDTEFAQGIEHLFERATAQGLAARYLDARARLARRAEEGRERWTRRLSRTARRVADTFRSALRQLWPVRRALGIGADSEDPTEFRRRTLEFADEVPGNLPVVYRRLFSFDALTDPRLLAGRKAPRRALLTAWHRWQAERSRSVMVIAPPGAGVTSFLNIASERLAEEGARVARHTLRERVCDESALAARLAEWLGLEHAGDLESLAERVHDDDATSLPSLVILEGAERLQMRVPGGGRLFERLLTFAARTESRILWVISMVASAWQLAERRSPAWVADVERIELAALTPEELGRAIRARHRLSGLRLRYVEPRTAREILRHRARSLWGTRKHRELLEADYFHKLHRASLGSIRLALFHWLRSADFRTVEGTVLMRPLEALPSFVHGIDLDQSFALKAILDHGTLTVAEYREVLRGSLAEGRHVFRTLADLRVIEPLPGEPTPYRIRPLMNGVVAAHLRSLNILH